MAAESRFRSFLADHGASQTHRVRLSVYTYAYAGTWLGVRVRKGEEQPSSVETAPLPVISD